MGRNAKTAKRRSSSNRRGPQSRTRSNLLTKSGLAKPSGKPHDLGDAAVQQQLRQYEEALSLFQQQKLHRAKQVLEHVAAGPSKELSDRARVHLRICEQKMSRLPAAAPKTAEDHYTQGVAMMNLGRWDEAREHLERARRAAPKSDHIVYAMAALDCLTGEAESAMQNLQLAIQLRPENRYHARNDSDFAFLQEDPRFTELLYPERDGSSG